MSEQHQFEAKIDGDKIRCRITAVRDVKSPVFCFSLMAPARVLEGGQMLQGVGGYVEVALPDLAVGQPHNLVIVHEIARHKPANRAWLPLGPYLRHEGGVDPLRELLPTGVITGQAPTQTPALAGLGLCPPPTSWQPASGTLDASRGLNSSDANFVAAAQISGFATETPFLSDDGAQVQVTKDPALAAEGYVIDIAPDGISVTSSDSAGTFYAAITLRQLLALHGGHLPVGKIEDAPRFGWRGQHLDCGRHFFEVATILRLLDLMALVKLNRFHWHFMEDEAFRLEISSLPDLWQKTAYRGEGELVPGVFGGGIRSGGSYSKTDVERIVAHAKKLHIEVLPEIEVPAHAYALNRAVPGLRDPDDTGQERSVQGYPENALNPAMDKTWEVLSDLASEVASLFPFAHLHLGCDELPPLTWESSPAVAKLKEREGLESVDDVQGWMMAKLAAQLADAGIRPAAWEEASRGSNGGIGNNALLFIWHGELGADAARAGYDVIMCPAKHVYLDMAHSNDTNDWGANWAAFINLEDTVAWAPIPDDAKDVADRFIGVQGTFWSEFTTDDEQMWPMLLPRLLGVACKAWEQDGQTDGKNLRQLAGGLAPLFAKGWDWHHGA